MGFPWARVKTWASLETLIYSDLNAEFDNILQNNSPPNINDYSSSVGQMQTQTSPGGVGTESLPTSLAGELERIRYVINRITGKTYWYDAPDRSLALTAVAKSYQPAIYMPFDGKDTSEVLQNCIMRGCVLNAVSYTAANLASTDFSSSIKKFGTHSLTLGSASMMAVAHPRVSPFQGTLTTHFYNIGLGDYLAYNPQLGIELYITAQGKLAAKITQSAATSSETAKDTSTVTGTTTVNAVASWKQVEFKYAVAGANGAGADLLSVSLNNVAEGTPLSAQTIPVNGSDGGVWYIGAKRNDPTWTKFSSMKVLPSSDASDAWTANGAAGGGAVSGGILTITTDTTNKGLSYSKSTNVNLTNSTYEFKMRIRPDTYAYNASGSVKTIEDPPCRVRVRKDSTDKSFMMAFTPNSIYLMDGIALGSPLQAWAVNTTQWHTYRITASSNTITLYVDGVMVGNPVTLIATDATAADVVEFGDTDNSISGHKCTSDWEYFAYYATSAMPPVALGGQGNIDDWCLYPVVVTDTTIEALFPTISAYAATGSDAPNGVFNKYNTVGYFPNVQAGGITTPLATATGNTWVLTSALVAISDGNKPLDISANYPIYSSAGTILAYHGIFTTGTLGGRPPELSADWWTAGAGLGLPYGAGFDVADIDIVAGLAIQTNSRCNRVYPPGLVFIYLAISCTAGDTVAILGANGGVYLRHGF